MQTHKIKCTVAAIGLVMNSMVIAFAQVQITYNVDMSVYQAVGLFNPTNGDTVLVSGAFDDYPNPPSFQLTNNPSGPNPYLYSGTVVDDNTGVGGTEYHEIDIYSAQSVPGLNYGVGYTYGPTYSFVEDLTPTNLPTVYFNDESNMDAYISSQVSFQLNMSVQMALGNFNPGNGDTVVVDGAMNNWNDTAWPLTVSPTNTNTYVGTFTVPGFTNMPPFSYAFVYINGSGDNWENNDRSLYLTNSTEVVSAYFNNQTNIGSTTITYQVNMGIMSNLGYFHPGSDYVVVEGSPFNDWAYDEVLTNSLTDTNIYYGTFTDMDSPGTVEQYAFVIDGYYWDDSWIFPLDAGGLEANRTFTVTGSSETLPLVYMGFGNLGALTSAGITNNQETITWNVAAAGAGIYLQTAGGLNGPWQAVPGTADAGTATVNIGTTNAFFRLAGPP